MKNLPLLLLICILISCSQKKESVNEWRGPGRSGIYIEKELLKAWPENGPEEILSVENIGNGYASPIVSDVYIFITGEKDSVLMLQKYDLKGTQIWEKNLGKEWIVTFPGARSAPTLIDSLLYLISGMGNVYCISAENGNVLWSKDFVGDFGGISPLFGHSEAPVIFEDKLIWTPGGAEKNVVALNRFTGDLIWSNKGFGERSAYNQPVIISLPERNIYVTFSAYHLMGFDCSTGEMLWSHEQTSYPLEQRGPGYGDTHANTIIYSDGNIYYAEGDGNCGVKLKLSDGGTKITEVWNNKGFDSYMGGIVKIDNYIYGGSAAKPLLLSINTETGVIADSLKIGRGVVISADNLLYYYNDRGITTLVSYDNGKMQEISSFKLTKGSKEHFSHPVIRNGVLYIRHGNALVGYKIKI